MKIEIYNGDLNIDELDKNKIYLFNTLVKDIPNVISIGDYNADLLQNKKTIIKDMLKTKRAAFNKTLVLSSSKYGLSLKESDPRTFEFLSESLKGHFNYDNSSGRKFIKIPGHLEITKGVTIYLDNEEILQPEIFNSLVKSSSEIQNDIILLKKIAFTNNTKYTPNSIIVLKFNSVPFGLVCRVIDSYLVSEIKEKDWSLFEGFNNSFIKSKSKNLDKTKYYQTHFNFICSLDESGKMIYEDTIFKNNVVEPIKKEVKIEPKSDSKEIFKIPKEEPKPEVVKKPDLFMPEKIDETKSKEFEEVLKIVKKLQEEIKELKKVNVKPEKDSIFTIIKNKFRRKTIDELLKEKNIHGKIREIKTTKEFSNIYEVRFNNITYYVKLNKKLLFNTMSVILIKYD